MRKLMLKSVLLSSAVFSVSAGLHAQDVASVTGIVTDASGAVISGADVILIDPATNTTYKTKTSSSGSYAIPSVRPAPAYKITFSDPGFQSVTVSQVQISVGATRTQNARLLAGNNITVEVSGANSRLALDTNDASIGNNLDVELFEDLPIQNRNSPTALFYLQAGVSQSGSVTGARTDQNSVTVDDLDVNDIASGQNFAIISAAPVDSLSEFRGTVAGQVSSNGPGGGGEFQLVTKNGTNHWHGDLNEYHRDTSTVANSWFNNNAGVSRAPLIRNQFGGNVGGPILKNKAFFFFDFNDSRIIQSSSVNTTVPLDSFRNQQLGYILANDSSTGAACSFTARRNTTPNCIGTLSNAQVAALDPQKVGFDQSLISFINTRYPHANDLTGGDGINTGGYRFTTPTPSLETTYVLRLDYNATDKIKLFARGSMDRANSTQSTIRFLGDPVSNPFVNRSYSYVAGAVWTIGSNKVNEFLYGDTITKYNFASTFDPLGTSVISYGALGDPYNSPSSQRRRVPIPEVRDDFNWSKGAHNITMGGTFKFIKTNSQLVNDFNFVGVGLGGNLPGLDSTSGVRPANIRGGTTAPGLYDSLFTTALGRVSSISSNYNYSASGAVIPQGTGSIRRYRYFETELYAGDSWKVTHNLTFTYGLRYQLYSVPYEANGAESIQNFTFNQYFADRVAQSASSTSGNSAVPFITYNLGGKANNAAPLYAPSYKDFAPHVAFAYNPTGFKDLVIRGSAGLVYDRTVINAVNFIQDQSSYLFQNSANTQYGSAGATTSLAYNSLLTDPRLGANNTIPAPPTAPAITKPYTPFVTASGVPYGLANSEFNTAIDPTLKDPYNIIFNMGIEQALPFRMLLKVNYAGRLGRRLLAQADASQLIDFADPASTQLLSTAFGNLTKAARAGATTVAAQPWFENQVGKGQTQAIYNQFNSQLIPYGDFADFVQGLAAEGLIKANIGMASQLSENTYITNKDFSNYNGLLITLAKETSHGLKFDFNYTWSHSIDNTSLVANSIAAGSGVGFVCDVLRPRECRGTSDFDQTTVVTSDFVYALPFGRGRTFFPSTSRLLNEAIGGWAVSGIPSWSSGTALNIVTDAYVAGYANNSPAIFNGNRGAVAAHAHKRSDGSVNIFTDQTAAQSSFVGPIGFNIGSRNALRNPSIFSFDAGLAKTFPILDDNKLNLKFRADFYNVLNHPVFGGPNNDINSASFGQITGTQSTARVGQFALRLEF